MVLSRQYFSVKHIRFRRKLRAHRFIKHSAGTMSIHMCLLDHIYHFSRITNPATCQSRFRLRNWQNILNDLNLISGT